VLKQVAVEPRFARTRAGRGVSTTTEEELHGCAGTRRQRRLEWNLRVHKLRLPDRRRINPTPAAMPAVQ